MENKLKLAIQAVLEAGEEILRIYSSDFDVEIKTDSSPVTIADKAADRIITTILNTSGIPIISEESETPKYTIRKNWGLYWLVDPLDGTKEFIKRNGEFTVNIALIENRIPVLGVIYLPVDRVLYFTSPDRARSYKIICSDSVVEIKEIIKNALEISPNKSTKTIKILASRSHLNKETQEFIAKFKKPKEVEVINKGSSLKFCLIAEGVANLYPRFGPTMEWDTAAGDAICRAVGISVIDQTTNEEITYNKISLINNDFIVGKL